MKLLVTGGCGFIGSNFIRYALREHPDWQIVNLDKLTYAGNPENLRDVENDERYQFVQGDICDRDLVDSLLSGRYFMAQDPPPTTDHSPPTVIVNFAAESHVDRSILDAAPFMETNVKGTQALLEAARTHWLDSDSRLSTPDSRRFLQISTDEVYGSIEEGYCTEDAPLRPNSPYAASKASADLLCRAYYKTYGLPVIITRSSNNYGPYQFPEKLIPLMITNALSGKPLPVYGDGQNVRDWLYVEDNCRAIDLILQRGNVGEIYNIAGGEERQNIELVELLCDRLAEEIDKPSGDLRRLIRFVEDRLGHDRRYAISRAKVCELGWELQYDMESGIRETIRWYLSHPDWIEHVTSGEYRQYYEQVYGGRSNLSSGAT